MKRLLCCLLLIALALSCAGCRLERLKDVELPPLPQATESSTSGMMTIPTANPLATPAPTVPPLVTPLPTAAPEPVPTVSVPSVQEPLGREGQVFVNCRSTSEDFYDPENGTVRILVFSYDTPFVTITGRAQATAAIAEQLAALDESFYSGGGEEDFPGVSGMLEMAEDNYAYVRQTGQTDMPLEYSMSRRVRTARADARVVSMVFSFAEYSGSRQSPYGQTGCVFDAETGERLTLADLSADQEAFLDRVLYCMVSLTETDPSLYEKVYVSYMHGDFYGTLSRLLREGSWYFDEEGLVVFSKLDELGPYNAGIAEFHIHYSRLEGYLDEKWLPAPREQSGSLTVSRMDGSEEGRLNFVDKVQTDEVGRELCLAADGTVYAVELVKVLLTDHVTEEGQLWYGSELSDAAIQLVTDIPDGMPNLLLRYTDASGMSYRKLLTESGEDGHLILLDESELFW